VSTDDGPLVKQAAALVQVANANAITAFVPMLERFPALKGANTQRWDFFMTIAGVFIAATRLVNLRFEKSREQALLQKVAEGLAQWDAADGISGYEDCQSFFDRTADALEKSGHDQRFVASDALGAWVVWNLFGGPPGDSEEARALIRGIGVSVTHIFFKWWEEAGG
jgi:hypothetical protein